MAQELTTQFAKSVSPPPDGNKIHYDTKVSEFGLRVTSAGGRAWVLNYRTQSGRERRYTIGAFPAVSVNAARTEAKRLKHTIRGGTDPLEKIENERNAPTMADLCERFIKDHVGKKRPSTAADYKAAINNAVLPHLRNRKVAEITFADIDDLHRHVTEKGTRKGVTRGAPYKANRVVAILSKMFSLAIRWKWISQNPAKGIERNNEQKRKRYLTPEELNALRRTLAERDQAPVASAGNRDRTANNIVRLLLLTGARSGETLAMKWGEVDLGEKCVWIKPSAHTKQKEEHQIPLSAPARLLLQKMRSDLPNLPAEDDPVFPGHGRETPQTTLKKSWAVIRDRATVLLLADADPGSKLIADFRASMQREPTLRELEGLAKAAGMRLPKGLRDLRLHDLRHSYASFLVNDGLSLPFIGALLGHTQASTTHRYAHLFDDPLRKATDRVGETIVGGIRPSADIVSIKGPGR